MDQCWGFFGDVIHGTKGCAVLGEGITDPHLYRGHQPTSKNVIWKYQGAPCHHYQVEHDLLFEAIRQDKPYNEADAAPLRHWSASWAGWPPSRVRWSPGKRP